MSFAVLLVPLLPLLAALLVAGSASSRRERARLAALPMGAAFIGAIVTLYFVATTGPIAIRFYDPAAVASWAFRSASTSTG